MISDSTAAPRAGDDAQAGESWAVRPEEWQSISTRIPRSYRQSLKFAADSTEDPWPSSLTRDVFLVLLVCVLLVFSALMCVLVVSEWANIPDALSRAAVILGTTAAVVAAVSLPAAMLRVPARRRKLSSIAAAHPDALTFFVYSTRLLAQGLARIGQPQRRRLRGYHAVVADRGGIRILDLQSLEPLAVVPWSLVADMVITSSGARSGGGTILLIADPHDSRVVVELGSPQKFGGPVTPTRTQVDWFARKLHALWHDSTRGRPSIQRLPEQAQ